MNNDYASEPLTENELAKIAVGISFKIHCLYGPGMFERIYERIFCFEWNKTGIPLKVQEGITVVHEGINMGIGFIPDVVIGDKVIIEFKSVEALTDVHYKQLRTHLKLTGMKLGLLINFNVPLIKNGIHRVVNGL